MSVHTNRSGVFQDKRVQSFLWNGFGIMVLALIVVFLLFPVVWMLIVSFKPEFEIYINTQPLWFEQPTLENYVTLFRTPNFINWTLNSLLTSLVTTIFSVVVGTMAAYALVRYRIFGGRILGMSIFATYLLPQTLLFIPLMLVISNWGLVNTRWSLILLYPTIMVPFCTWLMMGYFRSIPTDMEECARVDGASRWQAFYRIALPLARPGIISAAIFTFTLSWSEYLYALVFIESDALYTLAVGIPNSLDSGDVAQYGALMAGAAVGSLPVVLVYAFFMRYFVSGMMTGAVKG